MRHLVVIATTNPSAEVPGPRKNLVWSTVTERLHQVCKPEATQSFSHPPL